MYYVASEQVMRAGFKGRLVDFLVAPIARARSVSDIQTIISIFRRLKEKANICIFAEGSTSFDGETGELPPSIGKLVKKSGATLMTIRFTGSYFTFPRWARFVHKGKMKGELVRIYSPEELSNMQEEEITNAIGKDIYVNAYDDQRKNPVSYIGKRPAEYLESALYCCPECGQFGKLNSCDDIFSCACGFSVRYNKFCYFENPSGGAEPPFTTIYDWSKWQSQKINELALKIKSSSEAASGVPVSSEPIFSDPCEELFLITRASHNTLIASGILSIYNDRISVTEAGHAPVEFTFEAINDMSILTRNKIIFSTRENKVYEIHSKFPRSALKYTELFKALKTIN
jgi:hypothetical protein